jgi:copper(I)-binding protein
LAGLLAALFAAVLVVGGCGAGPSAQTSQEAPAVNGAESGGGPIVVRDAMIVMPSGSGGSGGYAAGATAPLGMWIVNQGGQPDRLLSASSPAATTGAINGDVTLQPGGTVAVGAAPSPQPSEADGQHVQQARIALVALREGVQPGQDYQVTLLFEHAGPVTLALPVSSTTQG